MIWLTFSNPAELSSTALAITLSPALIDTLVHRSACSGCASRRCAHVSTDGVEIVGVGGIGDQAHRRGLGARDRIPGEEVAPCTRKTDELRPEQRAPVTGDEPHGDMRIAEDCFGRRDHDVAEQRDRATEPDRGAVDLGDDRRLHTEQRVLDPAVADDGASRRGRIGVQLQQPVEVSSRRERATLFR